MDWVSIGYGVIGSLIATAIASFIAWSRGWLSFSFRSWSSRKNLANRLEKAGLSNFYASRDDYAKYRNAPRLIDYLKFAEKSIKVAAYWMAHGTEMEGVADNLIKLVKPPKNIDITIGIINPTSSYIAELALYLGCEPQEIVDRIESSLTKLYKAKEEQLSPDEKKRFRIKVYDAIPIASVIMLDSEEKNGRTQIDIKPYKAPRQNSFTFELSGRGHSLYDVCTSAWTKLLDEAEDFDPERHLTQDQLVRK